MDETETVTIALAEERLSIGRRCVETGRVRVHVQTESETVSPTVSLFDQHVEVERVPVGRQVTEVPAIRQEGDVTIVPILEEVLVVEKRLVLKEEVHIRRVVTHSEVTQPATIRRQRAQVDRTASDPQEQ